ncbi:TIR domain-containing protein, partial [Hymenobacter roseosalivarius]|uniref:TIR domain-containing protein n=1 Tax=Hymenobacter roseosalivarius TaxID=89967 RepID=UPI00190EFD9C
MRKIYGPMTITEIIPKLKANFFEYLVAASQDITNANPEIEEPTPRKAKGNITFIIHGHDELLKNEVQLLLTRAGVNNIVLHEVSDRGRTVISKLIEESEQANYAVALLTPDD